MKKRIIVLFLLISVVAVICGCSQTGEVSKTQADEVADETVFTPPEEDGTLAGSWTAKFDVLTENCYFYGDGKYVSLIQDPEEETWCVLAYWSEKDKAIELKDQKYYAYDSAQGKWNETDQSAPGMISGTQTDDNNLDAQIVLPDGNQKTVSFGRGMTELAIPSEMDINLIINGFTIH